jgi:tight adherence protein B
VPSWAFAAGGVGLVSLFVFLQRRWHRRQVAISRIPTLHREPHVRILRVGSLISPLEIVLPWVLGILGLASILIFTNWGGFLAIAVGVLFFVVGFLIRSTLVSRRALALETQLAEAIDHVVTSLHAGVGVLDALQSAERDAPKLLKPHLLTLTARIRLGDDPVEVCKELADAVPLESFRLFYYALAVQWEGGGNLAPTLATTGRFIRDRIEVSRRVRAHTTEARFSVLAVLALTYLLALLMWHLAPDRVEGFLATEIGQNLAAIGIVLQALGAVWVARMSRIKF